MDSTLLNKLAEQVLADSEEWFPGTYADLSYSSLALCGEAGEFGNIVKKIIRGDRQLVDVLPELREELADVLIYVLMIAAQLRIDLFAEYVKKRNKNQIRFGHNQNGAK